VVTTLPGHSRFAHPPLTVEVDGPHACFTRPELTTERVSYPVMSPGDAEHPVAALIQVLAGHRGQQLRGLRQHRPQLLAVERGQHRPGIPGQRIHQRLPGRRVIVVTRRLTRP
jgi:hypothetical protein